VDRPRPTASRDQDRVRPHAGERVCDDLALLHGVRDPFPLGSEPRAEVRRREIDPVSQAVLHVDRRGPPLARDHADVPNPMVAFDPPIVHDDPDPRIPSEDCTTDRLLVRTEFFRDPHHGDVADHVERAGQRCAKAIRHLDEVLVAPDGHEAGFEFPFLRREADLQPLRCREQDAIPRLDDAEMLHQDSSLREHATDLLGPAPWHRDAPRSHDAAMPEVPLRIFARFREAS